MSFNIVFFSYWSQTGLKSDVFVSVWRRDRRGDRRGEKEMRSDQTGPLQSSLSVSLSPLSSHQWLTHGHTTHSSLPLPPAGPPGLPSHAPPAHHQHLRLGLEQTVLSLETRRRLQRRERPHWLETVAWVHWWWRSDKVQWESGGRILVITWHDDNGGFIQLLFHHLDIIKEQDFKRSQMNVLKAEWYENRRTCKLIPAMIFLNLSDIYLWIFK